MPDYPIIDTHVHFWDSDIVPIDWLDSESAIAQAHLPRDLTKQANPVEIEKLVFVEAAASPGSHIAEVDWVSSLAEEDSRIVGIVAHAPLERGAQVADDLKALADRPLVRGIRRLIQAEQDPGFCLQSDFVSGVKQVHQYGFHFEICIRHNQLDAAIELVRRCPETDFVLDHIGKPDIKAGLLDPWRSGVEALATLPNVVCKLSGVATEANHDTWTAAQLRPYIEHVLKNFGPERTLFGGDWPVSTMAIAYPQWVFLVDEAVSGWSEPDRRKLFRNNAIDVYRL